MKLKTKDMILVALFAALTAVGGFLKIQIPPAPVTLQFLFTALAGVMLGAKLGALSQLVYVLIGLMGIPVFTKGGGIGYIYQPSFGYLIGFILGAYVIGKISENSSRPSFIRLFIACILGLLIVYIIGVPYLYFILTRFSKMDISLTWALQKGFLIFLPGDIAKSILTSIVGVKVVPVIKREILGK